MSAFDRLKKLCDKQGISINKLEENIGLGKNTLYSWSKNTPKGTNLLKVADYFGVTTDYLLGRTDDPYFSFDLEFDEEVRVLAREMQQLDQGDKEALLQIIKSMRKRGKEALDE